VCCMIASSFLEKAQLHLIYVAGWATLRESGGALNPGVGCPTRVLPGPASVRAPPSAEFTSRSSGSRRRLTRPWSRTPSRCQGMAPFSSCPFPPMRRGRASCRVGRLPPSRWSGGWVPRFSGHRVRGRSRYWRSYLPYAWPRRGPGTIRRIVLTEWWCDRHASRSRRHDGL
jgi:hypothetical protein